MQIQDVDLRWLGNSGFLIQTEGKNLYIDPYKISCEDKADIILITHPHNDHCSIEDIEKISKDGTIVLGPADIQSKITRINKRIDLRIVHQGDELEFGDEENEIGIRAVPAYNLDKEFHPKSEGWLGYLIETKTVCVYHLGDTDMLPEMEKLKELCKGKEFVVLLPVGGKFTMNYQEAAKTASLLNPSFAIPMHYNSVDGSLNDAENFAGLCEENGIKAVILDKE